MNTDNILSFYAKSKSFLPVLPCRRGKSAGDAKAGEVGSMSRATPARLVNKMQAIALIVMLIPISAFADKSEQNISIQPQSLQTAINQISRQMKISVYAPAELVRGYQVSALDGVMTPESALTKILAGSGLEYKQVDEKVFLVVDPETFEGGAESYKGKSGNNVDKRVIEEITVTAQKREQSLYDVPISILAFRNEDIEAQKITDFKDLALAVPGLLVSDSSYQRRVFMRGLGNISGSSSMVGIYVDETSVSAGGVVAQQLDLRMHDLERIEVLRGPQGTIYGQGSMSGTIRFITKDPQLDHFGVETDIEASFTQDGEPGQKVQAVANIPLVDNELGLRIAATYEQSGGWVDQPIGNEKDINDQDLLNVRIKGLWKPSESFSIDAMAIIHRNEGGVSFEQDDGNVTPAFDVFSPATFDDEYDIYSLTLSYDFGDVNLISASNYVETNKVTRNVPGLFRPPFFTADGLVEPLIAKGNVFSQELRLSSTDDGPWQWSVGGFYEDWEIDSLNDTFFGFTPGAPLSTAIQFSSNETFTSESWALFGNTSFALTSRLEIGAGLRYFEDERTTTDHLSNIFNSATFDTLNPRVYVNYDLTDNIKIYSSAAKGFRSGGTAAFSGGVFEPDEIWTYELGSKGSFMDGRLKGDLAIFYSNYEDVVVRVLQPGQLVAFDTNAGDADILGVEWSFVWQIDEGLRLGLLGTYVDTEYTSVTGTQRPHLPGDPLDLVKDYQFTLWVEEEFTLSDRPGSIRMDYNRQGPASFINHSFPFFLESDVIDLLNLHVSWKWSERLKLGVFAQNLLNDRGSVEPINFGLGDGVFTSTHSRPRTVGIEFGLNF